MVRVIDEPHFRNKVHIFDDRFHAGKLLAEKLVVYKDEKDTYILTIPSDGVPIAFMVSKILGIPMDLVITRKIHIPWNKEAGLGAISWDGVVFLNESLIFSLGLTKEEIARCVVEEKEIIRKRLKVFRGNRPFPNLIGSTVIVMDDGLASGYSMLTTVKALQKQKITAGTIISKIKKPLPPKTVPDTSSLYNMSIRIHNMERQLMITW